MDAGTLISVRLTQRNKIISNISLEKTMAILASEHFAIHGNLENIKNLESDATTASLIKLAPFLIFKNAVNELSTFHHFYLNLLYEFCQITEINKDLIYKLVNIVAQQTYPQLIQKIKNSLEKKTDCFSGYTTDPETIFVYALQYVFKHLNNPIEAVNLASCTRIYDVKKITVDMCMAIHGLNWILSDSVDSFIKQHQVIIFK